MTEPSLMEDPCAMDSWAALHLPSIELLLSASSDVFEDRRSTGIGDSRGSFFQSVLNAEPFSPGRAQQPEDLCFGLQLREGLEDLYKRPARDLHSGYWTLEQPKEVGSGTDLSKKPVLKAEAEGTDGGAEGRMNGRIGHKKVLKRINIQEEFGQVPCEITTAMIRNVPNQLNRKQFVERLDQLGFHGMYDFVYVPIDRATRMNVGYAFVNFVNPDSFRLCQSKLQGKKFLEKEDGDKRRSGKPIIVSAAHVQGLENNERHFKDAAVAHTLHRPVKFSAEPR
ncbi:unnamed protein product [Durusdinium trenchii]|uniref:RRM domain-containing protein n=1 Tax=Durusdinium trenchii TaxID=1381693 RepID=A0ABP0QC43_9DINO